MASCKSWCNNPLRALQSHDQRWASVSQTYFTSQAALHVRLLDKEPSFFLAVIICGNARRERTDWRTQCRLKVPSCEWHPVSGSTEAKLFALQTRYRSRRASGSHLHRRTFWKVQNQKLKRHIQCQQRREAQVQRGTLVKYGTSGGQRNTER